jgi:hypothetical protein
MWKRAWIPLVCLGLVVPVICSVCILRALFPWPPERVTWKNYQLIQKGMTKKQVVSLLGPPTTLGDTPKLGNWELEEAVWGGHDCFIHITFSPTRLGTEPDVVVEKRQFGLNSDPPPIERLRKALGL